MGYNRLFVDGEALNESFESAAFQVRDASLCSIQARFTGSTCSFTAEVWISNDPVDPQVTPSNFDPYPDSAQTFTQAGTFTWEISELGAVWVKLVVTDNSSGANTGELFARANVKGPL